MPAELLRAIERSPGLRDFRLEAGASRPGSDLWRARAVVEGRPRRLVVKVIRFLRPEDESVRAHAARAQAEFDTLRRLRRDLQPWPDLRVPEPIMCLPEHRALILEEVGGETLKHLVLRQAQRPGSAQGWRRITDGFRAAGRWLGVIQSLEQGPRERLDLEGMLAYDEVRLQRLVALGCLRPRLADGVRAESRRLRDRLLDGPALDSVFVHGDFCPSNMLLDGDTLVVLDFTMVERGSTHQDLTYCFEYLERFMNRLLDRPFIRRRVIRELQAALLDGYRERMPISDPLFRLHQIRHHLNYLVNMHEPALGPRRWVARFDRWRARRGLEAWLDGRGASPAGARP